MNQLVKLLESLELDSKVIFLNEDDKKFSAQNLTKETQKRLKILSPDAVYIFNSQPLLLFYDFNKNPKNKAELHKKIWSFDEAPIVFIIDNESIQVFNALNYIKEEGQEGLEQLNLSFDELRIHFNLWELESGYTWRWFQDSFLQKKKKNRVNQRLFNNIKTVRNHLVDEEELTDNQANSLILRLIFIRYLIDRSVKIDEELLPGDPKDVNRKRKNLIDLIKQPERLNKLFVKLNKKFNGVLFKELEIITKKQANYLSKVFSGELEGEDSLLEGFFFEIFDFSVIPVELISGIYESLIDEEQRDEDSAIYTPSFLVDYILKDTVDEFLKTNKPEECTVFEVAVGSGIFLVQSLRRMIEKEIELNGKKNKDKFGEKIKSFAENNLYGIDINPEALKVTCFSIYIALLDYLEPADINNYRFPKLIGSSLFESNFFGKIKNDKLVPAEFEAVIKKVKPKFILGNPPWKKDNSKEHLNWVNSTNTYSKKISGKLEIAQSFLLRTKEFMDSNTICSLIVTSTIFYNINTTTKEFKKDFLTSYNLKGFFDLSPVRRLIFENKSSPASFVNYTLTKEKDFRKNIVKHQSVKANVFLKNFKLLVVEKFDKKEINQSLFIENDWMFKVALYGNSLDFSFIKKLKLQGESLAQKIKQNPKGAGILKGNSKNHSPFFEILGGQLLNNSDVKMFYTSTENFHTLKREDILLKSGKIQGLFKGYQILFKEQAKNESDLIISYAESWVFKKGIFGINFSDQKTLKEILSYLLSDIYIYFIFLISGSWGTSTRPQIRWKEEYLSFPIFEPQDVKLNVRLTELVNQIIKSIQKYQESPEYKFNPNTFDPLLLPEVRHSLDDINSSIEDLYQIKDYEKDIIDYALQVSRYQFQESKQDKFLKKVDGDRAFLKRYGEVFLKEIGNIYPEEFIQIEIYRLKYFLAMNFVFKKEEPKDKIIFPKSENEKAVLQALANNFNISKLIDTEDPEKNLFVQKDIKGFEKDSFYIIKPNEFKSWHRARAWYDVAEIKEALQNAELDTLNNSAKWV